MPFTRYLVVAFGSSRTGLTTVGYTLVDTDGTTVAARSTAGVEELGEGEYAATVTCPDGFRGRINWDTGESPAVDASEEVNPPELSTQDAEDAARLATLEAQVTELTKAPPAYPDGTVQDGIVRAGVPEIDDCKVLNRLKAFVVDQGVQATVEHIFRDRQGRPMNLSLLLPESTLGIVSASGSVSDAGETNLVKVRVKEFLGAGLSPAHNPVWEIIGDVYAASIGALRAGLSAEIVERPGIYEMFWAITTSAGDPLAVDRSLLSIEPSMFPADICNVYSGLGPPTLQEIRMRLMDSSANENTLLEDIEFKDDQILLAMVEPVRYWNENPPPLRPAFTTRTFPFRGAWVSGVLAQLHLMAANHYRRNRLQHSAGGTAVDDKNKEREYLGEGQRLWGEYTDWVKVKKIEINIRQMVGHVGSTYASRSGW